MAKVNQELAKQWHPTKNGSLAPHDVTHGSKKKVWWRCEKGHEWKAVVCDRTRGRGCPYCAGRIACASNCLATLFPEVASQWHPTKNGEVTPNDVTYGCNKKAWWRCEKGHEWYAIISSRTTGRGCPYCAGRMVCASNCLATLFPEVAGQWHPTKNGEVTPHDVTYGCNKKVWWRCEKGHEWKAVVCDRTRGHGCPYCAGRIACDYKCKT